MAVFLLDTDTVSSVQSTFSTLASKISNLSGTVNGYDTSCTDFDFSSAKSVIAANLEACSIKISNTATIINDVVVSHMSLQNDLRFGAAQERANSGSGSVYDSAGGFSSSGTYSASSGGGGASYASAAPVAAGGGAVASAGSTVAASTYKREPVDIQLENPVFGSILTSVASLSAQGKEIVNHKDFKYGALGIAEIGGMFVISCHESLGKVGDVIVFTLDDGTEIKCIIGQTTDGDREEIRFFVNEDYDENNDENITNNISDRIVKIQNIGANHRYTVSSIINNAIDWAINIANDNSHGYSQASRWGSPSYDCSSFVISAFESAGIPVKAAGANTTHNMRSTFTKVGFVWIPGNPNVNDLLPGDVVLRENHHTEMYIGDGKLVAAAGTRDNSPADLTGQEITVRNYHGSWDGVLRYVGA